MLYWIYYVVEMMAGNVGLVIDQNERVRLSF